MSSMYFVSTLEDIPTFISRDGQMQTDDINRVNRPWATLVQAHLTFGFAKTKKKLAEPGEHRPSIKFLSAWMASNC